MLEDTYWFDDSKDIDPRQVEYEKADNLDRWFGDFRENNFPLIPPRWSIPQDEWF